MRFDWYKRKVERLYSLGWRCASEKDLYELEILERDMRKCVRRKRARTFHRWALRNILRAHCTPIILHGIGNSTYSLQEFIAILLYRPHVTGRLYEAYDTRVTHTASVARASRSLPLVVSRVLWVEWSGSGPGSSLPTRR